MDYEEFARSEIRRKNFLMQTAMDYDMPVEEVERIYNQNPKDFYNLLEDYIAERRNSNKILPYPK